VHEPSSRPFWIALGGMAILVLAGISFLVFNIIDHAEHHTTVTPVATSVTSVFAVGDGEVAIEATVTSQAAIAAQVSCLLGVELPAEPLAYPIRVTEQLDPGQTKTIRVTRSLLKPAAHEVELQDVAFTCT
jgi:hypothetical protein